jgi:hypothetical protein
MTVSAVIGTGAVRVMLQSSVKRAWLSNESAARNPSSEQSVTSSANEEKHNNMERTKAMRGKRPLFRPENLSGEKEVLMREWFGVEVSRRGVIWS